MGSEICIFSATECVYAVSAVQGHPRSLILAQIERAGGVALPRKPAMKRGKIGPRLLLMTNRKSHTRFRLVPKSTTLDDQEGSLRTKHMRLRLSEPTSKIWMKIDSYCQRWGCSRMILVSSTMRFMRIFAGIPWRWASNNSEVMENVDFRAFGR